MSAHYNWDNSPHERLYNEIHGIAGFWAQNGAGVSGAAGAQDGWAALAELMARAREGTETALAEAGAVWEGAAGYAMRSGLTPLARWADDAHTASTATQTSTDTHVESYTSAKNQMPEPVPVTSTANSDAGGIPAAFIHLLGGQTDQDRQEAAAQEAKAEAVRIMTRYEASSGFAQITVGQFVPPPSVTVDVPPAQPQDGDGIPVGDGAKAGTGPVPSTREDTAGGSRGPGATTPPPGSGSTPPPGSTPASQGATTPSFTATTPSASPPPVNPVATGAGPDTYRPGSTPIPPGMNTLGGPGERGVGGRGQYGRGFGGGFGEGGGTGRTPGGPGAGGGARGAGGPVGEPVAGRTGAAGTSGARGVGGMGVAPAGRRGEGDEDKEHAAAEYLRDFHDDFWDDTPPVAPAVIGEDED